MAAAGASSQGEFFTRLRADGLLVRRRLSERNPGEVTGYAVALPDRYGTGAAPVYLGGGKLATDLTLPRLQCRWAGQAAPMGSPVGPAAPALRWAAGSGAGTSDERQVRRDRFGLTDRERQRIWEQATLAAQRASEPTTSCALSNPTEAADAAWRRRTSWPQPAGSLRDAGAAR